jgi:sec-independent protein translocase protein TatA
MLLLVPLFIGTTELILIAAVALLLFGGKKLPELMRGLGRGVKEFKEGMADTTTKTPTSTEAPTEADAPRREEEEPKQ